MFDLDIRFPPSIRISNLCITHLCYSSLTPFLPACLPPLARQMIFIHKKLSVHHNTTRVSTLTTVAAQIISPPRSIDLAPQFFTAAVAAPLDCCDATLIEAAPPSAEGAGVMLINVCGDRGDASLALVSVAVAGLGLPLTSK